MDEHLFMILEFPEISVCGMVFSNENIHNGSGFILGANEYSEPDLTNELAERAAKPSSGQI